MRSTLAVFCLILSYPVCGVFAQVQHTVKPVVVVGGLDSVQTAGGVVYAEKSGELVLSQACLITVEVDASQVSVKAENKSRERVEARRVSDSEWLVVATGELWVRITAIDFDKKLFQEEDFRVVVDPAPPGPDPSPGPEPDLDGDFDGLAAKVRSAVLGLEGRAEVSSVYFRAASMLSDPKHTQGEVGEWLTKELEKVSFYSRYTEFSELINRDVTERWPLGRRRHQDYLRAIAAGVKGQADAE